MVPKERRTERIELKKDNINLSSFNNEYINNHSYSESEGIINNKDYQNFNYNKFDDLKFQLNSNYINTPIFHNLLPNSNNNFFFQEKSNVSKNLNISPLFSFGNNIRNNNHLNNSIEIPNSIYKKKERSIIPTNNIISISNINNTNKSKNFNIDLGESKSKKNY